MLLITDYISGGGICAHLLLERMRRSFFQLNDLVISRRKIQAKPALVFQLRRDLRAYALW